MEKRRTWGMASVALLAMVLSGCGEDFLPEYVDEVVIIPGTVFTVRPTVSVPAPVRAVAELTAKLSRMTTPVLKVTPPPGLSTAPKP